VIRLQEEKTNKSDTERMLLNMQAIQIMLKSLVVLTKETSRIGIL
jgi:hypothetical protein